ncbi:MAG: sulfite exporter TauE/SafE family protein [Cellvibrionaceae bacterium]
MFDFSEFIFLFFIAIVANGFSAIAGGGAGLLQLPILIFLGLPFATALATHKIATVALGIGSTARYWKEKTIDLKFSLFILSLGLPGVVIGAMVILNINERLATFLLGLLTLALGIYSFFKKELGQHYTPKNRSIGGYSIGGLLIFLIGFINGSLTSGTGLFLTLWLIYWFGLDYKRAVAATMILVGFFWNATGAVTLSFLSTAQWSWLPPLILGSLIGGYLGASIAVQKGNQLIKRLFEIMTITVGISLIAKAL